MVKNLKGSSVDVYDRMQGVKPTQHIGWDEECIYCRSRHLHIHPLDVSYRPANITDFSDLPPKMKDYYSKLPTVVDAVLALVDTDNILITCLDCNQTVRGFCNSDVNKVVTIQEPNKARLRQYLNDFYGVTTVMNLEINRG